MGKVYNYKAVKGTEYYKALQKHFKQQKLWGSMYEKVSAIIGQELKQLGYSSETLFVNVGEIEDEDTQKLFTKDGKLKNNSNRAKEIREQYLAAIAEVGLEGYMELSKVNFIYGIGRTRSQSMTSFATQDGNVYYQTDFDLTTIAKGNVVEVSEVDYHENYLNELWLREEAEGK